MLQAIQKILGRLSRPAIIIISLAIVAALGAIDYATGSELAFSIFYLLPVFLVTWYADPPWNFVTSCASAVSWLLADTLSPHLYSSYIIPAWNTSVRLGFFVIFSNMLLLLKKSLRYEKELARSDSLTGIANSRFFYELVAAEVNRARRTNEPMTFVYLDIDNFKDINDQFGHSTGDDLLRLIASTLSGRIRVVDILARIGGDEFIILLPQTGFDDAHTTILRIQKSLLETIAQNHWSVTVSFGMVTCIKPPDDLDDIIKTADRLMYKAKNRGKNSICHEMYSPEVIPGPFST